jgi:hypothetical protein
MPAGNDAAAAVAELADRFGLGDARAEDLVSARRKRYSREAKSALRKERNKEETDKVSQSQAAKAVEVKTDAVTGYAVRGDHLVVRFTDDTGRAHKRAVPLDEVSGGSSSSSSKSGSSKKS